MADIFSKKKRSQIMSNIRATETKPEIIVRQFLFSKGYRFRKNVKSLPGKPDIVLPKYKTVVFIHGCFWHGHKNCKKATLPSINKAFWKNKINSNVERDRVVQKALKKEGWKVLTIWECKLKSKELLAKEMNKLLKNLDSLTSDRGTPNEQNLYLA